jgi:formate-dependent nitrite reductase cytochrome c552 subunit
VKAGAGTEGRGPDPAGAGAVATVLHAIILIVALVAPAQAAWEGNHCVSCHESEKLPISLGHSFEEWSASAHARGGVGCEKCHGGDPTASDAAVAHRGVLPASEAGSLVSAQHLPQTCGACHAQQLQAYASTVHARQVAEHGRGATCFTCHGSMATSLPSPAELSARCGVCHKKPVQAQAALAVLATAKIRLYRMNRILETAKAADPAWHADAEHRFHDLERTYRDIVLKWHTFAMDAVLRDTRDLLKLTKLLDEETAVKSRMEPQQ